MQQHILLKKPSVKAIKTGSGIQTNNDNKKKGGSSLNQIAHVQG